MLNPARTLAIAGLLLAPLAVPVITPGAASASTDGTRVVISEVYGAGGNSGAPVQPRLRRALQPGRRGGGPRRPVGAVPVGDRHLEPERRRPAQRHGPRKGALPARPGGWCERRGPPGDRRPGQRPVNLSGSTGTVFLANQKTVLPAPADRLGDRRRPISDLVGFGTSNTFETAVAPAPGTTTSISRTRGRRRHRQQRRRPEGRPAVAAEHHLRRRRWLRWPGDRADDRAGPGHDRHQPVRVQERHHVRRGHGVVPDRRPQRLLRADRRAPAATCRPGTTPPTRSSSTSARRRATRRSATTCRSPRR